MRRKGGGEEVERDKVRYIVARNKCGEGKEMWGVLGLHDTL